MHNIIQKVNAFKKYIICRNYREEIDFDLSTITFGLIELIIIIVKFEITP